MVRRVYMVTAICLLYAMPLCAQAIDNMLSFKNINDDSYFRLNYENDVFSGTDIYYTQGIQAELVSRRLQNFFLSKILAHLQHADVRYGIGAEHDVYTPTSIISGTILRGDRPFAACLLLKTFSISIDTVKKQRFCTAVSTGIIGQAAGGMEMQTGIHRWLHDVIPHGWQYQVRNDVILNYQADYEKLLLSYRKYFSVDAAATGCAGTLSDKAGGGVTMMLGYFDSPFGSQSGTTNGFRIYAYEHPAFAVIGYDATLEGGLFNHTSPYAIRPNDITRLVFSNRVGMVASCHRVYVEYFQSYTSNEFKTGTYHVWGGVQVAFGL